MISKRSEERDERNSGFGISADPLEKTKPGVSRERRAQAHESEGHHRYAERKGKAVPEKSLADRIAKTRKGA